MIRLLRLLFLIAVFQPIISSAQNIYTYAGTGTAGYSGDGSAATSAKINQAYDVVGDVSGNLYIADYQNARIRKVSPSGIISTFAGTGSHGYSGDGGQATAAQIGYSRGIALDPAGYLYFSDDYSVVRRINLSSGLISTVAGIASSVGYNSDGIQATAAKLNYPIGIAVDYSGNLLIADQSNNRVRKVNMSSGIISTIAGTGSTGLGGDGGPATAAQLNVPSGVAASLSGNIYIADYGNNRVRRINTAGNIAPITFAGSGAAYGYSGDGGPSTAAHFYYPTRVTTDTSDNIYITDENNNVIRKINRFGIITTIAGNGYLAGTASGAYSGDGGLAVAAELNQPGGVSVVPSIGKIYIADRGNDRIRVINTLHSPSFTNGHRQSITLCQGVTTVSLDTLLAIDDIDVGQTEIWNLVMPASHGALVVGYTATSTGSTVIPTGLTYSPFGSYYGPDSFSVRIYDGSAYDTTVIYVDLLPAVAYNIIGRDSLCPGDTTTLSYITPGGTWTSQNTAIASVSGTGFVKALTPGHDTITYTFSNACGTFTSVFPFAVGSYAICHTGVATTYVLSDEITVSPNPNYGVFTLEITSQETIPVQITITNIMGAKVKEFTAMTNKATNVWQDYPAGVYFISASNGLKRFATKMIIKQ